MVQYKKNYELVDSGLTQEETAEFEKISCSPNTTFGYIAAIKYIFEATLEKDLYDFFNILITNVSKLIKFPI